MTKRRMWLGWGVLGICLAAGILAGCGNRVPEGCSVGDEVPSGVRRGVLKAADVLYDRVRGGKWQEIYTQAAGAVRDEQKPQEFLPPLAQVAGTVGIPAKLSVRQLATVHFEGPALSHVTCTIPGQEIPVTLLLTDFPTQASLVQAGETAGETYLYSTLWYREKGTWRLASFYLKPGTWDGKDWKAYAKEAADQRLAGHPRNAALLYNVVLDLLVPNIWTQPPDLQEIRREQGRLNVTHLPIGRVDPWPAAQDTFKVMSVGYTFIPKKLALLVKYVAQGAVDDTTAQAAYGDRLARYIGKEFPEYADVFGAYSLVAVDPKDPKHIWNRLYPIPDEGK